MVEDRIIELRNKLAVVQDATNKILSLEQQILKTDVYTAQFIEKLKLELEDEKMKMVKMCKRIWQDMKAPEVEGYTDNELRNLKVIQ